MQVEQKKWSEKKGWEILSNHDLGETAHLVLVFGSTDLVSDQSKFDEIRDFYPRAEIVLSSGAGEIAVGGMVQHTLIVTAMAFRHTQIKTLEINLEDVKDSFDVGAHISAHIEKDELCNLMIFSNGNKINGSHLLTGLQFNLSAAVPITGGLAGSYAPFSATYTGLNNVASEGRVIGVGFYGSHLQIGHSSHAGWVPFGPERFITKSTDNMLFELDNMPVLDFYKKYFEGHYENITEAMRLHPLGLKSAHKSERIVRAFLEYNPENGGALFAGDMPEEATVRMMKTNIHALLNAANDAALASTAPFHIKDPDLVCCVSCVGRQFILRDWIDEEIACLQEVFGHHVPLTGYYSYGEIAPQAPNQKSELHNHTMTVTTLKELD